MSVADTPRPDPATRPAGSAAWALHERSTRRFQLRGRSHHPGQANRLLVHHLPAANAVQFEFDTRGDPPALVSETYVRR